MWNESERILAMVSLGPLENTVEETVIDENSDVVRDVLHHRCELITIVSKKR